MSNRKAYTVELPRKGQVQVYQGKSDGIWYYLNKQGRKKYITKRVNDPTTR